MDNPSPPLIALDVHEHACYLDSRGGDYVEKFMAHIDWQEVDRRLRGGMG